MRIKQTRLADYIYGETAHGPCLRMLVYMFRNWLHYVFLGSVPMTMNAICELHNIDVGPTNKLNINYSTSSIACFNKSSKLTTAVTNFVMYWCDCKYKSRQRLVSSPKKPSITRPR